MYSDTFYSRFFHFFLLSVLVVVCYSNTLEAPWHFDDYSNIVDNSSIKIKELSLTELRNVVHRSLYDKEENPRPVAAITFALNYLYSGKHTSSYHVVNIFLHLVTAWTVYLVFGQTIYLYTSKIVHADSDNKFLSYSSISLLGSVLWAIHPIHTQAVTYIVQRQAVLAAMFYMLAMYCYIKARLSKGKFTSIVLTLLFVVCFLLGVGSKQNAALLPLSLVGYEIAFFRQYSFGNFRKNRSFQIALLACIIVVTLILSVKGGGFIDYVLSAYQYRTFTMWERIITQPIILLKYIFLLLTPLSDFLALESDIIASRSFVDPLYTLFAMLAVTCLGLSGLYMIKRFPIFGFAIFFFFANHLIESTFIPLELYFEHRNYLPSVFIYLALAFLFVRLICFYQKERKMFMKSIFLIFCMLFLVSAGNATYLRNDVWKDDISLMQDSIEKSPYNIRPYITISSSYMKLRMPEKAKQYLKKAEDMYNKNPGRYQVNLPALLYYNAGILYTLDWEKKDLDKAIALLFKSTEIYPADFLVHMTLGALLFEKGDYEQAERAMVNTSALHNDLSSVYYQNYGRILYANGKVDEAIISYLKGLETGDSDELRLNLVAAYLNKGDRGSARFVLNEIPKNNNTPVYLLCYALLNSGLAGDAALEKLAGLMADNSVSYCEWIERMRKNNLFGIIYPDFDSIENTLKVKYLAHLDRVRDKVQATMVETSQCNL